MLLPVPSLQIGSIDAVNYRAKSEKEFFNRIFYKDKYLEAILEQKKYFLIGEKGTEKTSYAVILANSEHANTRASITPLTATDYRRFISLKGKDHFGVSSYDEIWRVIVLVILAHHLIQNEPKNILQVRKFKALNDALAEYYQGAFSPEVTSALEMIEQAEVSAGLLTKHAESSASTSTKNKQNTSGFAVNLRTIERRLQEGIQALRLEKNHIIFFDGIDIRPSDISYGDYLTCVKGLAQASWDLNSSFFSGIKDSPGRVKVTLLLRPDILGELGYQNLNAKIRDNGVVLDWRTTYQEYRKSRIFHLFDGLLAKQQGIEIGFGTAWDLYFPYKLSHLTSAEKLDNAFIGLLRYSLYRPRDIVQYLIMMQEYVTSSEDDKSVFSEQSFYRRQSQYSDYLLGEVKDQLSFYYSDANFEDLTLFFSFLEGKSRFEYKEFIHYYGNYLRVVSKKSNVISELISGPERFLQFLYSLNIIGYAEKTDSGTTFIHWCFRDRTPTVLNPKVRFGLKYHTHPGLARALRVGGVSS